MQISLQSERVPQLHHGGVSQTPKRRFLSICQSSHILFRNEVDQHVHTHLPSEGIRVGTCCRELEGSVLAFIRPCQCEGADYEASTREQNSAKETIDQQRTASR